MAFRDEIFFLRNNNFSSRIKDFSSRNTKKQGVVGLFVSRYHFPKTLQRQKK
jgi:hypothetical protein